MNRPSLAPTAAALLFTDPRFPWVGPSAEEKEVALVLLEIEQIHTPDRDQADNPDDEPVVRTYGFCLGCAEPWPCPAWLDQEREATSWLCRAATRVRDHACGPIDPVIVAMRVRAEAAAEAELDDAEPAKESDDGAVAAA